jgi:hypothetical protein
MKTYFLQKHIEKKADRDNWQVVPNQGQPARSTVATKQTEPEYTYSPWKVLGGTAVDSAKDVYNWLRTPDRWLRENAKYIPATAKDTWNDLGTVGRGVVNEWSNFAKGKGFDEASGIAGDVDKNDFANKSDAFMVPITGGSRLAGNLAGGLTETTDLIGRMTGGHGALSPGVKRWVDSTHRKLQDSLYASPESRERLSDIEKGVAEGYLYALQSGMPAGQFLPAYLSGAGSGRYYADNTDANGELKENVDYTAGGRNHAVNGLKYLPMFVGKGPSWAPGSMVGDFLGSLTFNLNNASDIKDRVINAKLNNENSPMNSELARKQKAVEGLERAGIYDADDYSLLSNLQSQIEENRHRHEAAEDAANAAVRNAYTNAGIDAIGAALPYALHYVKSIPYVAKNPALVPATLAAAAPGPYIAKDILDAENAALEAELEQRRRSEGE